MSEEQKPSGGDSTTEIGNLKQEMNRKLSSYETKLTELTQANQLLVQKLSQITVPKATAKEEDDFDKVWYDDPRKAAARIKESAKQEILEEYKKDQEIRAKAQSTLATLVSDYPELNDANNELTKKAVEIYNSLSDYEKTLPSSYKLAVKDAASDLGILPVKKRATTEGDEFTGSSAGGYVYSQTANAKRGKEELDPRTIAFAQLVGLNVQDEKVMSNLKARAKRSNWTKFE